MADGEKRIKELSTINELNSNHFFVVDDNSSGGATKKFPASNYNAVKTYAEAALYNEIDVENYLWAQAPTYTKGNVVINPDDGKIYICVVASSTQGQFVDAEWDRMNLYGMCLDVRDDISNEPMKLSTQSTTYPINKGDIVYRYVDGDDGNSHFYAKFYRAKEDHPNGVTSFVASDWDEFASLTELLSDCNKQIYSLDEAMTQALVEGKASGEIATFTDGSNLPLKSLEVAIEPVQSGSGDPSLSNVRPISGWTEANIVVSPTTDAEDGTTYTIQFKDGDNPLTVYGGTLDVVSGELTVDRKLFLIDGDSTILTGGYGMPFKTKLPDDIKIINNDSVLWGDACNMLKEVIQTSSWGIPSTYSHIKNTRNLFFKLTDSLTDINELKDFLTNNPIQLVYELATPLTIQLTPTIIKSLQGENNFFASTGEILDATYVRNANITINDLIRRIEALES